MEDKPNTRKRFESCVETCADSMYRVARRLTGSTAEAEDLVQETYVQAWQKIESLRDADRMRSWMFAILRNQYLKSVRKKRPVASEEVQNIEDKTSSMEKETEDPADVVQRALMELEEDQRLPILLVSMEGMSAEEASGILGIPRGTVLSRMHRGRKRLKEIIEQMEIE